MGWKRRTGEFIFVASVVTGLALCGPGPQADSFRTDEDIALDECRRQYEQLTAWLKLTSTTLPGKQPDPDPDSRIVLEPDPWRQPYRIDREGPRAFRICSNGPDAAAGTNDDVCYPVRNAR